MPRTTLDLADQMKADRGLRAKGSRHTPYGYDRPGRSDAIDDRYDGHHSHDGKRRKTLRDHRKGSSRIPPA